MLWMVVIFSASSDRLSFQHTSRFIGPFVRWLMPHISERDLHAIIFGVRKCAHLSEYAILALLCWRGFGKTADPGNQAWSWRRAVDVLLLVALYAATDEFHQKFVPSREASVLDVLIDVCGGAFGLIFPWIVGRWRKLC